MKLKFSTYPFAYLTGVVMILSCIILITSCGTKHINRDARANIHLPVNQVEEQKDINNSKKLPSVIDMKDRHGNVTTYAQTETDEKGNSHISVQLGEVTVTAKLKNVPERFGKVDVDFIVSVPEELINKNWQLNLTPHLIKADNISDFEELVISGEDFKKIQQKQYADFDKYLSQIVPDSLFNEYFVKTGAFNRFISRYNRNELQRVFRDSMDHVGYSKYKARLNKRYEFFNNKMCRSRNWLWQKLSTSKTNERNIEFRRDTLALAALYTKRYEQIVNLIPQFHLLREFSPQYIRKKYRDEKYSIGFTNDYSPVSAADSAFIKKRFLKDKSIAENQKLIDNKHIAFADMVKYPRNDRARLDTVIYNKGKFEYYYKQEVMADEYSRRMKIYLDGYVQSVQDENFLLPHSDTLDYIVSSMVQFLDTTPRYMRKIIERKATSSLRANITFKTGKHDMDIELGDNRYELEKVQDMVDNLTMADVFEMDSISLVAGCSLEGNYRSNMSLSKKRAEEIQKYLSGLLSDIDGIGNMLKPYPKGEDWENLSMLIQDSVHSSNKQAILDIIAANTDPDDKETAIRQKYPAEYKEIRDRLYPLLRAVDFTFHVHRKGMVKDTIHTSEPDTIYAKAMEFMNKRRYSDTLPILSEYNDFNTAICLMSLGYDVAAYNILVNETETANREYLLAIVASRMGKVEEAVSRYLRSVELDPAKRWRGTLDPEINKLIKAYNLNNDDDE
ncbi:hypothetical protein [Dysgonomonas macrotermitis]|uniref:Uncharacterized protein n=1 Tax=Dysgonomonas macrotermitis TaxID=1346286 RepID=A0A1M5J977_9BACT|nr:hypothetical protein [Dysgonomonas macrotermitis]SHG36859.1 hypothetical protein SAMN05444362_12239 [Dysgonomonas macrotermitis]